MKAFLLATVLAVSGSLWAQQERAVISIQADQPRQVISKHICGHFAEHLGRCIYDGFWVNSSLNVPKEGPIRMDIVDASAKGFKGIKKYKNNSISLELPPLSVVTIEAL